MNKFQFVEKNPYGNRYVISDIHGCPKTLIKLVECLELSENDQLFFLGDYIDRGPDSKGVLDYIIELTKSKNIYPLIGNHESTLLEYNNEEFRFLEFHLQKNNALDLLKGQKLNPIYVDFINSLPFYYELDNYFIVHAGFDYYKEKPYEDYTSMLWIRDMPYDEMLAKGKKIIIGHQPTYLNEIEEHVKNKTNIIPLDNGLVYRKKHKLYDYKKLGKLAAFNLDTFELIFEGNIDIPLNE